MMKKENIKRNDEKEKIKRNDEKSVEQRKVTIGGPEIAGNRRDLTRKEGEKGGDVV